MLEPVQAGCDKGRDRQTVEHALIPGHRHQKTEKIRAETDAEILLLAKNVDGIYDSDRNS